MSLYLIVNKNHKYFIFTLKNSGYFILLFGDQEGKIQPGEQLFLIQDTQIGLRKSQNAYINFIL